MMKFIAATLLLALSANANEAEDSSSRESILQAALRMITKSLPKILVGEGDWTSQLKGGGLVDNKDM